MVLMIILHLNHHPGECNNNVMDKGPIGRGLGRGLGRELGEQQAGMEL